MTWVEFNINDSVRFKVRGAGEDILHRWRHRADDVLKRANLETPEVMPDPDGFYEMQMWEFMQVFGPHCYMGPVPPIETTILLAVVAPR